MAYVVLGNRYNNFVCYIIIIIQYHDKLTILLAHYSVKEVEMIAVDPSIVISVICIPERILLQVGQASRDSLSLSVSFLCPIAAVILRF